MSERANAISVPIHYSRKDSRLCLYEQCTGDELEKYFIGIRKLATTYPDQFALMMFEFATGSEPTAVVQLLRALRTGLNGADLNILVSVSEWEDRTALTLTGELRAREGVTIAGDRDPDRVVEFFRGFGIRNSGYTAPGWALFEIGTRTVPEELVSRALQLRNDGRTRFVYGSADTDVEAAKLHYMGVDGIVVDIGDARALRRIACGHCSLRLARRADNPFNN